MLKLMLPARCRVEKATNTVKVGGWEQVRIHHVHQAFVVAWGSCFEPNLLLIEPGVCTQKKTSRGLMREENGAVSTLLAIKMKARIVVRRGACSSDSGPEPRLGREKEEKKVRR